MPSVNQHVQYAENYRRLAEANIREDPTAGGELLWGAAVQAAQASIHRSGYHEHPQSRNQIINAVGRTRPTPSVQREMSQAANAAAKTLHASFYHPGDMDPIDHQDALDETGTLITYLLRHAHHPSP